MILYCTVVSVLVPDDKQTSHRKGFWRTHSALAASEAMKCNMRIVAVSVLLATYTECWVKGSIHSRWMISTTARLRVRHDQLSNLLSSSAVVRARNKDGDGPLNTQPVFYNDDAFGLVLFSSLFVAKDYTFARCFGALSMLAVVLVKFQMTKFTPLLPGLLALLSYAISRIIVGSPEEAVPVELATCLVSLAWGYSQKTTRPQ
jgi:hypothetical protein